jgi:hypothetical protein
MSCWVVPSVAAELWGCTIDAVLCAIRNGNVPTKEDAGWTFVDVAPESPKLAAPKAVRPQTPETFAVVSQAEHMTLVQPPEQQEEHQEREMHGDWRKIRRDVAALRRAPLAEAA